MWAFIDVKCKHYFSSIFFWLVEFVAQEFKKWKRSSNDRIDFSTSYRGSVETAVKKFFTCANINQQQFSKIIFLCSSEICLKIEKLMLIWKLMLVSTNNSWCPRRKNNWHKKKWQWLEKSCVKLLEKRVLKVGWKKNILFLYK